MKKSIFNNPILPYLLVAPQLLVVLVFFFWPAFETLHLSVFTISPFGDRQIFVGLDNFIALLTSSEYYRSVYHSFLFSLGVTFSCLTLALFLAVLVNQKIRGLAFYRSAILWTFGMAPPISGVIWLFIFHPTYGILNYLLSQVTSYEFNWLLKDWLALVLVIFAASYAHLGYNVAFFLAALQGIPNAVVEAARVDGAGGLRLFRSITFPLLSPVTFFLFIMNMVFSFFETFGIIHAVTQGGPGDATSIMVYKTYVDGFVHMRMGLSAAQSFILMALVIFLTVLQFRYTEKKVSYS
ncbi:MAG TPA: ABC transporter permease subunit [Thermodesulfobacteriota bacterium]|nr:ABC transporter permease subunit [Thermodesulfobacteriota bacterium]